MITSSWIVNWSLPLGAADLGLVVMALVVSVGFLLVLLYLAHKFNAIGAAFEGAPEGGRRTGLSPKRILLGIGFCLVVTAVVKVAELVSPPEPDRDEARREHLEAQRLERQARFRAAQSERSQAEWEALQRTSWEGLSTLGSASLILEQAPNSPALGESDDPQGADQQED